MPLREIVRALGGDLLANGHRASIPAPNHSKNDRSVSLVMSNGRVVVHCFTGIPFTEILDKLRDLGLIDSNNAPTSISGNVSGYIADPKPDYERQRTASDLWASGKDIARTISEQHARLRGIRRALPGPNVVRHTGLAPISVYQPRSRTKPGLMVAIRDPDGEVAAVELTYLEQNARRATSLKISRKTIGRVPTSSASRIDPPASEMLVAEGFFTTLSATERFQLPGWALLSTGNLRYFTPPSGVRKLLIAADNGTDGRFSAELLADRMRSAGLIANVQYPPDGIDDWNTYANLTDQAPRTGTR